MSDTFGKILELIEKNEILISAHGYEDLAQDIILVRDVLASVAVGMVVEDYPEFAKGPCV